MARTASKSPWEAIGKPASRVHLQALQLPGHLELFLEIHAAARRLLAIPQRGIKYVDSVGHRASRIELNHCMTESLNHWIISSLPPRADVCACLSMIQ
jgi:hypothetical protein